MIENSASLLSKPTTLAEASGEIPYKLTNDYMFRALLQKNEKVLTGLICALLHLKLEEIKSVEILNPIELGESVRSMEYHLDIIVKLNDNEIINLEMQVNNLYDWPNRSLAYLCRSYDQLTHGETYANISPVMHIGFLDYTLFPKYPEFYATYKLLNVEKHYEYNSNFAISVIDLTHIELATGIDKEYEVDKWARMFKASTWDELKAIVGDNEVLKGAADTMFDLSNDFVVQKRARDREDYLNEQRYFEKMKEETIALQEKSKRIEEEKNKLQEENERMEEEKNKLQEENEKIEEENNKLQIENSALLQEIELLRKQMTQ